MNKKLRHSGTQSSSDRYRKRALRQKNGRVRRDVRTFREAGGEGVRNGLKARRAIRIRFKAIGLDASLTD